MAAALENLIDLERGRGAFDASLDTPTLAFAIVRVGDGFLYSDVIADRASDIGRAVTVIEALLRGLDLAHRSPVTAGRGSPDGHRPRTARSSWSPAAPTASAPRRPGGWPPGAHGRGGRRRRAGRGRGGRDRRPVRPLRRARPGRQRGGGRRRGQRVRRPGRGLPQRRRVHHERQAGRPGLGPGRLPAGVRASTSTASSSA